MARQVRPWLAQPARRRSTQSAWKRSRRRPAEPIRDSELVSQQKSGCTAAIFPSSRHELRAWQTGGVHVRLCELSARGRNCARGSPPRAALQRGAHLRSARRWWPVGVPRQQGLNSWRSDTRLPRHPPVVLDAALFSLGVVCPRSSQGSVAYVRGVSAGPDKRSSLSSTSPT